MSQPLLLSIEDSDRIIVTIGLNKDQLGTIGIADEEGYCTIVDRLKETDLNRLSPLEALNLLHELKKQLE